MKLILHIGRPKTGTTSIQQSLRAARDQLLAHGVFIDFSVLGPLSNARFSAHFEGYGSDWFRRRGWDKTQIDADSERFELALDKLIREAKASSDVFLISSEQLSRLDSSGISSLRRLVDTYFSETEVVAYFREQGNLLVPSWHQSVRATSKLTLTSYCNRALSLPGWNYMKFCYAWETIFDRTNLRLGLYQERNFNVVEDFWQKFLPQLTPPQQLIRLNRTLTPKKIEAIRRANSFFQIRHGQAGLNRKLNRLARRVPNLLTGRQWDNEFSVNLSKSKEKLRKHFRASNELFLGHYFPDLPTIEREQWIGDNEHHFGQS